MDKSNFLSNNNNKPNYIHDQDTNNSPISYEIDPIKNINKFRNRQIKYQEGDAFTQSLMYRCLGNIIPSYEAVKFKLKQ